MDTVDQVVREDVRDLTRIIETENVASLIIRLPDRVGFPLSLNVLREDMQVSYTAVKNAISALQLTHVIFLIPPYSRMALERALELLDLTITDHRHLRRLKELTRLREALLDYFDGDNLFASTEEGWRKYFYAYGFAARAAQNQSRS